MTLLLTNQDADALLSMADCLAALEEAYAEVAHDRAVLGARSDIVTKTAQSDAVYQLKSMSATVASRGVAAVRINSDILSWPMIEGKRRRQKLPLAPGDRWTGLVLLFSTETGEPLAIFPDGVVQRMRVAAASGLGVKYLAREDARTVGLIGAGWQAGSQVMAVAAVRNVETIRCYSPTRDRREAFCRDMAARTGLAIEPAASGEEAVRGSDIVLCATNSLDHVFFRDWLEPGMHLGTIRDGDLEAAAIRACDVIAMHDPASVSNANYHTTHGLRIPDQEKEASVSDEMQFLAELPILPDLIVGRAEGRTNAEQTTCFLNFRGLAIQFAAVGGAFFKAARKAGAGRDLPTDWFTENVHP